MKKIFSLFLCILLLAGCENFKNKDVKNEPLDFSGFTCTLETVNNDVKICANADYKIDGSVEITFLEPLNLKNISLKADDENITLCQGENKYTYPFSKMPLNMICKQIKICGDLSKRSVPFYEDDNLIIIFNMDNHLFKVFLNSETRKFEKLVLDNESEIIFKNFEFIK